MKKVAFIMAGLLAIMLAGCGEGSSSSAVEQDQSAIDGEQNAPVNKTGSIVDGVDTNKYPPVPAIPDTTN